MYKDKERQREANRQAQARFKAKAKGITEQGITLPEKTDLGNTQTVGVVIAKALHQGMTSYPRVSDQDFTKLLAKAGPGLRRVSKPGDEDYVPNIPAPLTHEDYCKMDGWGRTIE